MFSNLLSAMVLAPVLVSRAPSLSAGFSALVATSTVFSIVAIALDRYRAVLSPLHYAMTVTRRRSLAGECGSRLVKQKGYSVAEDVVNLKDQ